MKRIVFSAVIVVLAYQTASTQMLSYSRGQNVSPAFEGWEKNDDGSFNMMFGYMNRNWEEEVDVPIGPEPFLAYMNALLRRAMDARVEDPTNA